MATAEHERRRLMNRTRSTWVLSPRQGPSKADLQRELAEAVRNTAAQQQPEES